MQSSPVLVAHSKTKSVNTTQGSQTASPPCPLRPYPNKIFEPVQRPHQGGRRICLLICLGALCPVRFITWLVVGFRSSFVVAFQIQINFVVTADYCVFRFALLVRDGDERGSNGLHLDLYGRGGSP